MADKQAALSEQDKAVVVESAAIHLETDYVEADETGLAAARALREAFESGAFDEAETGDAFADLLTERLRTLTGDGHLGVEYSAEIIAPDDERTDDFNADQAERYYGAHINYGVFKAERLDGNIGLLDLRVFPPIAMGAETIAGAMSMLADTDALIIDLRKNGGGIGDTADFVASYLFGTERQPLTGFYDKPTDTLTQSFTHPFVPGKRFGPDKPVYILISPQTFSAAEALSYNLQALGRATIVGETSGGGAHPFDNVPIHPQFVLASVTAKSVHPITGGNWQSVGVRPDIEVPSDQALGRALAELSERG
ncbi:MAG: S41 family peptidase [Pseudomonadota bacterium]